MRLRIRTGDQVFTGHGLATDVIEASARAYLAALSKVIRGDRPHDRWSGLGSVPMDIRPKNLSMGRTGRVIEQS